MEDIIRRTYWSGAIKVVVELLQDEDGQDYYGCDVYTNLAKWPCAVYVPKVMERAVDDEEALADAARSALSFASDVKGDVMGIADAAEIETIGKGCTVDRWKLTVVPTLSIFANHLELSSEAWDAVEFAVREAFPHSDLWLELDDISGDAEITIEPAGAIDEAEVRRVFSEAVGKQQERSSV